MSNLDEKFLNYLYKTTNESVEKSYAQLYGIARSSLEGFLYNMCLTITHKELDNDTANGILYQIESAVKNSEALGVDFDTSLKTAISDARASLHNKIFNNKSEPGDNFDELW